MLSDTTGRRITGLREREDMTLDELAAKIGINATTLGRIEKGQTQKINSDVLVALAREFSVSTDFLLGLTSIPERKNYDVSELGLSAQSVRNLGFPLHFRGVGYPCCQIAAWIPRPENANNSTVLHPQSRGVVTARLEYIQQYLPDGNQGPYTICSVSWFPCCRLPASAGWSCCRHRTFPLIGVWKSRFPSSYPTVYRK